MFATIDEKAARRAEPCNSLRKHFVKVEDTFVRSSDQVILKKNKTRQDKVVLALLLFDVQLVGLRRASSQGSFNFSSLCFFFLVVVVPRLTDGVFTQSLYVVRYDVIFPNGEFFVRVVGTLLLDLFQLFKEERKQEILHLFLKMRFALVGTFLFTVVASSWQGTEAFSPSHRPHKTVTALRADTWDGASSGAGGSIEQIEFKIHADGRVEETVRGVKGNNCHKVTEKINKQLGKVVSSSPTEEMFQEEVKVTQKIYQSESDWEGSSSW